MAKRNLPHNRLPIDVKFCYANGHFLCFEGANRGIIGTSDISSSFKRRIGAFIFLHHNTNLVVLNILSSSDRARNFCQRSSPHMRSSNLLRSSHTCRGLNMDWSNTHLTFYDMKCRKNPLNKRVSGLH